MKWFIKCLSQHTDFSGRARRQEYWMFTLFNVIFCSVWLLATNLVLSLINAPDYHAMRPEAQLSIGLCPFIALLLPGWAVTVRRLHDVGKSAWILLVALIPFVGGVLLLVLMLSDGQRGDNQYGADPKTLRQPFATNATDKSVSGGAILMIAAATAMLLADIANRSIFMMYLARASISLPNAEILVTLMWFSIRLLSWLPLLFAAICLLRQQVKIAFILLLAAASIHFVLSSISIWLNIKLMISMAAEDWRRIGGLWPNFTSTVFWLLLALFATFALWCKAVAHKAAMALIVIAGSWSLLRIHANIRAIASLQECVENCYALQCGGHCGVFGVVNGILQVFISVFLVACIVLAIEFLAGRQALRIR